MKRRTIFVGAALAVAAIAVGSVFLGRGMGESMAKQVQERLSLLWPDLMEMRQEDRTLLAVLAYECRLPNQPAGRTATIACLRSATGADSMKKVSHDPAAQLDKLLGQARPAAASGERG